MTTIHDTLARLSLGEPESWCNLSVFPLFAAEARTADYLTLDEALAADACRVTEVPGGGRVPELQFENRSDHRILLLDGEELVGAKQNRVLNVTILAAAKETLTIPVSCVEEGRWAQRSAAFSSAKRTMYARGRAEKMAQVSASLKATGTYGSHQGEVWRSVARKASTLRARAPTGAMADIYEQADASLDDFRRRLRARPGQAGAVFALNGRIAGLELFDAPETFAKLFPKLLDSYAMDALETPGPAPRRPAKDARGFLERVGRARNERYEAIGDGRSLRLDGERVIGGALEADGWLIHLSAFELPEGPGRGTYKPSTRARLSSLASRRRHGRQSP
jgi:hypothetical protein